MTIDEIRTDDVKYWQRLLRLAGYYRGNIDGLRGPLQREAEAMWDAAVQKAKNDFGEFDSRTEGNLGTVLPAAQRLIRQWFRLAQERAKELECTVKLISGTRTYEEQNALYAQGRTKSGQRVTNARGGYSWHNFGLAVDFGVFRGAAYLDAGREYTEIGKLARQVSGLEWGGDWTSFKDLPHIQMRMFKSTSEARNKF